ncbi:unnamed protein product [Rhizophagus irregularis]|uniref:Uncharacterized protein n=1 Tax=Rhizophagus irregularis TaxID=588596 RepID=A0A915ZLJ0_9GLOM|nr:unnamed protein product [Rhizophagus irregularis]CAB5381503.1 unnamed protein product [Rhizophagus irregularis]
MTHFFVCLEASTGNYPARSLELWLTLGCQELYCERVPRNASFFFGAFKGLLDPICRSWVGLVKNYCYSHRGTCRDLRNERRTTVIISSA